MMLFRIGKRMFRPALHIAFYNPFRAAERKWIKFYIGHWPEMKAVAWAKSLGWTEFGFFSWHFWLVEFRFFRETQFYGSIRRSVFFHDGPGPVT